MDELWLPVAVPEFSAKYEVSNTGFVRNTKTKRVLRPMRTGCKRVSAPRFKVRFRTFPRADFDVVHLVLLTFVGPRPTGAVVMHLDDDANNNAVTNLRWGTPQENMRDMVSKTRGGTQKLSVAQVQEIASRRSGGESGASLAREFGVSVQRVCDIYKGRSVALNLLIG